MKFEFPTAKTKLNGQYVTKKQYEAYMAAKEEKAKWRAKSTKLEQDLVVSAILGVQRAHRKVFLEHEHSMTIPLDQLEPPTPRELQAGLPVCCGNTVKISRFMHGAWYCPTCRQSRVR